MVNESPVIDKHLPWPQSLKVIMPNETLEKIRCLVESNLRSLHQDYFPALDFEAFLAKTSYPGAPWVEYLSNRVLLHREFSDLITNDIVDVATRYFGDKPKYLNICGIRFSFPSSTSDGQSKVDNYAYTPLHLDNYDDMNTLSFWIPLDDVNVETGGLMWTYEKRLAEFVRNGVVPTSSEYHTSKSISEEYLSILKTNFEQVNLKKGDACVFGKTLLHGGAYSISKSRISADFRLLDPKSIVNDTYRPYVVDLANAHKAIRDLAFSRLVKLGDIKFVRRHPLFLFKTWLLKPRGLAGHYTNRVPFRWIRGLKRWISNKF